MCYYFDDLIKAIDINFKDILLEENLYKENSKNVLIYDISYKTSTDAKPLRIRYDEINGFIKIQDRIKYLIFLYQDWFHEIGNRIKYHMNIKNGITDSINHNFAKVRIDSYNSLD